MDDNLIYILNDGKHNYPFLYSNNWYLPLTIKIKVSTQSFYDLASIVGFIKFLKRYLHSFIPDIHSFCNFITFILIPDYFFIHLLYLSICLISIYLLNSVTIYLHIYLSIYVFIKVPIFLLISLFIY